MHSQVLFPLQVTYYNFVMAFQTFFFLVCVHLYLPIEIILKTACSIMLCIIQLSSFNRTVDVENHCIPIHLYFKKLLHSILYYGYTISFVFSPLLGIQFVVHVFVRVCNLHIVSQVHISSGKSWFLFIFQYLICPMCKIVILKDILLSCECHFCVPV